MEPLKYVFGRLLPLLALFLMTVISLARDRILAPTPARLLLVLACVGLAAITVLLTYLHTLRVERRGLKEKLETKPTYMFGVGWDEQQNPLCPSCGTPLSSTCEGVAAIAVGWAVGS